MELLKDYLTFEEIKYIEDNLDRNMIFNLECNDDIIKIIEYLISIGINVISELIVHKPDLFILSFDQFMKDNKFTPEFVNKINEDFNIIYEE